MSPLPRLPLALGLLMRPATLSSIATAKAAAIDLSTEAPRTLELAWMASWLALTGFASRSYGADCLRPAMPLPADLSGCLPRAILRTDWSPARSPAPTVRAAYQP